MAPKRSPPPEFGEDLPFQRRQWAVQRWGWVAMLVTLALGLLGLFGGGPLSWASAEGSGVRVEYERFLRRASAATLTVRIGPEATREGTVTVWMDQDYLHSVHLEWIAPTPERELAGPDRQGFVFRLAAPGEAAEVTFRFEPDEIGPAAGRLWLGSGAPVAFGHFVYP